MEFPTEEDVINCLRTVVDPEFPMVDIYTMGLIYNIKITANPLKDKNSNMDRISTDSINSIGFQGMKNEDNSVSESIEVKEIDGERDDEGFISYGDLGQIIIDMTLTTPACPAADYLPEQAKNSVQIMYPEFEVILNIIWDPTWTIAMIKDEDLKRMFE